MRLREHIDFQSIKQKLDLREIAGDNNLKLDRRGYACCPFHHEKTPSMRIEKEYYYCFGCHDNGDVFDFLIRLNGWSLLKTVEHLNDRYHLGLRKHVSRREREEAREEARFRNAIRNFDKARKKKLDAIARQYTDEFRELYKQSLNGDNECAYERINTLNEVLDEYLAGNWAMLLMLYESENGTPARF